MEKVTIDLSYIAPSNVCKILRAIQQELGWTEEGPSPRREMLETAETILDDARLSLIGDDWY